MRILLVNQAYHPDHAATAQHAHDLVRALAARGHQVTVVASRSVYGHAGAALPAKEMLDGAQVLRVGRAFFGKRGLAGRMADFLLFHAAAAWRVLVLPRQDVVIALTTPPLIGFSIWPSTRLRGAQLVSWVMDLYPDVAVAGGVLKARGLPARLLGALNRFSLKKSAKVVALGRCMEGKLRAIGVSEAQLALIPPWAAQVGEAALAAFVLDEEAERRWQAAKAASPLTVLYSGNLGLAHDTSAFKTALLEMKDDARFRFVFAGGGKKRQELEAFAKTHGLVQVAFPPYAPREALAAELAKGDVHLVSQSPAFTGLVVPSKFYGILAAGRPVAVAAEAGAEIARATQEAGCGRVFTPDEAGGRALAAWLRGLANDPAHAANLGRLARTAHEKHHRPSLRLAGWVELIESLA